MLKLESFIAADNVISLHLHCLMKSQAFGKLSLKGLVTCSPVFILALAGLELCMKLRDFFGEGRNSIRSFKLSWED